MRVLVPADYFSAKAAIRLAAEVEGPVYVRMGRHSVESIYDETFKGGFGYAGVLREGTDVTICACGVEVAQALEAARILDAEGVSCEVIDVFSVSPLDEEKIIESARKTGRVVCCEEHMVTGGMGSAIAEVLSQKLPTPMCFVGMRSFGTSAPGDDLMAHFGLDADGIVKSVREFLA